MGQKVSLIAFRQFLTKTLPPACIQLHNYDLFEKAWLKLNPLLPNKVQQDYLPESYTRYLPSYQKCQKTVAPTRCGLTALSLNLYGKPWGWVKTIPNSQKFTHFTNQKNPPNRFKSFTIKSFISSPSNNSFQVITPCNIHL